MTTWTARRVGDRILCGRQVPPGGPYSCMGEIGTRATHAAGGGPFLPRPGVTPVRVVDGVEHYRATTRVRFSAERLYPIDEASGVVDRMLRGLRLVPATVALPAVLPCSHRGHDNLVTPDVVSDKH